mgnify:CR=1 FL=1
MELLTLRDLFFCAGNKIILNRLSLTVAACEIHALIGTNGSGKSTLASMVMGCEGYTPASGDIILDGRSINDLKIHERARLGIAMAWQEPVRFEGIGITEYLTLGDSNLDPATLLTAVGLEPSLYLQRQVDRSLSGGERRRIELASVLGLKPRLAILDEPDSGIDMLSTGDIISVVKRFKDNGAAVLLITHQEEITHIADRASLMHKGQIISTGKSATIKAWYKERKYQAGNGEE